MITTEALQSTWRGNGLRREVFTFGSGEASIYGSLYAPDDREPASAFIVCAPWGIEGPPGERLARSFARGVARAGASALVFDWPGQGESEGEPHLVEIDQLIRSVYDAAANLTVRFPRVRLALAGLRLGSAIAALAAKGVSPSALVLMQPVWDPAVHFASMEKAAKRSGSAGEWSPGWAFGFPLPSTKSFEGASHRVLDALERYLGRVLVIGYGSEAVPSGRFNRIDIEGEWRRAAAANDTRLADAAVRWLQETARTR